MAVVVQASVKINHLIDSNVSHLVRWGSICQNSNQKQAKQNASTTFLETNDSLMRYYGVCVPFDKDSLTEEEWQSCLQKKKKKKSCGKQSNYWIFQIKRCNWEKTHMHRHEHTHPDVLGEETHVAALFVPFYFVFYGYSSRLFFVFL